MKSLLIFCLLVSNAFAAPEFINSKAGLTLSGGGQPTMKQSYSFTVKRLQEQLCRPMSGYEIKCDWKGNNLVRTEVNAGGTKKEHVIVFEKIGDVAYVTKWFIDGQDYGRRVLIEMAKLMANLEDEVKPRNLAEEAYYDI